MPTTATYDGFSSSLQAPSGGIFTATSYIDANSTVSYTGSDVPVGASVSYTIGNTSFTGTYEGAYVSGGTEYPLIYNSAATEYFLFGQEDTGNYPITQTPYIACFVIGTRILTSEGEVPVEELAVGDLAVTASGRKRAIKWIGNTAVDCLHHPDQASVWPVRISANALGPNRPKRDLLVSPGHAICLDLLGEVLIPASALINGATIVQVPVDALTYWHVELDGGHDILLAEGQPAESYMDVGNRSFFEKKDGAIAPDCHAATHENYCRPFHIGGALVETVRSQLHARAFAQGWTMGLSRHSGLHLLADGVCIEPEVSGNSARFVIPASAKDVWLISDASVPRNVSNSAEGRLLGIYLTSLEVDDGLDVRRSVLLNDPLLSLGFHQIEHLEGQQDAPLRRWTTGRAKLPAELFAECRGIFFLRVGFDQDAAWKHWVAPEQPDTVSLGETHVPAEEPIARLRLVANGG